MVHGVDVVIVEPATISTPIWDKSEGFDLTPYSRSPYLESMKRMLKAVPGSGRKGTPPDRIGSLVVRIFRVKRPRARYVIGKGKTRIWIATHLLRPRTGRPHTRKGAWAQGQLTLRPVPLYLDDSISAPHSRA